jgi:hypothetical protein
MPSGLARVARFDEWFESVAANAAIFERLGYG